MALTTTERGAMTSLRNALARLRGAQAPIITSKLDRLRFMRRHWEEIDRSIRMGGKPADLHLTQLAAHCLLLQSDDDEIT